MADLIDAICDVFHDHWIDHKTHDTTAAAQAVKELIIARIPPLVWDERNRAGHYRIEPTYGQDKYPYILMCGINPVWGYDSEEAAKAAANAHHVAQLCKGMGIE